MKHLEESYDFVVAGGGLAGVCAAVAAARHGLKTCLVHDRPVLGGNASSEVRVSVHGAACHHFYARETGIIGEVLTEERARNHEEVNENGWVNSVLDLVLLDLVTTTPNLTVHLNTVVEDVVFASGVRGVQVASQTEAGYHVRAACAPDRRLAALVAYTPSAETRRRIAGRMFADCTGDALVADLGGCAWRMGTEGIAETGEAHAPAQASADTMGNSIHIRARDIGRPAPFTPPAWAKKLTDHDFFYKQGRVPHDPRGGFWWIELGVPWHTIDDAETLRQELTAWALGIWDWMKNRDPVMQKTCATYALDWFGQVPGKRESRRVVGRLWVDENMLHANPAWDDEVAYGGWFVDLHTPGGLLAPTSEPHSAEGYKPDSEYGARSHIGPYGIPLRCLVARDLDNLLLAGRNVSVTHAALGTVRVMGTTALMGQAIGSAAALAARRGCDVHALDAAAIADLQQILLRDGCFLPHVERRDPADLAPRAVAIASSQAVAHGAGPHDQRVTGGQKHGNRPAQALDLRLGHAQAIALGDQGIRVLSVCLRNATGRMQELSAVLRRVDSIFDYRWDPGAPLAKTVLQVPPGDEVWVEWPVDRVDLRGPGWARLDLGPNPDLAWLASADLIPGHVGSFQCSPSKLKKTFGGSTFSYRCDPPQACFPPSAVLAGAARPHRAPNCWRSDPAAPLPQHLELAWPAPVAIRLVEICFAGHLLREVHAEPPFFRDPQTARDYLIQVRQGGTWTTVHRETGNYQRQRRHDLGEAITADALRLVVTATNGDRAATVYEVRVYG